MAAGRGEAVVAADSEASAGVRLEAAAQVAVGEVRLCRDRLQAASPA